MKVQGIYVILNILNNKCYIGSSRNIRKRKSQHIKELKDNLHYNAHLQAAWNKYGADKFIFTVLEEVADRNDLWTRELHWIKVKNSLDRQFGYNLGVPKSTDGMDIRPETKLKLQEASYRQHYGKNNLISFEDFMAGKRAKDLKELKGNDHLKKRIFVFDNKTGERVKEYPSITALIEEMGRGPERVLSKLNLSHKGLIYLKEEDFDENTVYKKHYKERPAYIPKGSFNGHEVETYDLITLETVQEYPNKKALADSYETSVKYLNKVFEGSKKSFRGLGVRYSKSKSRLLS